VAGLTSRSWPSSAATIKRNRIVGFYNTGDRIKYWGKWGAFWGGLWGLLFGAAFLIVPGMGPVVAAGSIVAWIIAALEGSIEPSTEAVRVA
jgi:hypothetical protein